MFQSKFFAAVLVAGLTLIGGLRADSTVKSDNGVVLRGYGRLAAAGFGSAEISGECLVYAEGVGNVSAPAGITYKSTGTHWSWSKTSGNDLSGVGRIGLRLKEGDSVTIKLAGRVVVWSRLSSKPTVSLKGKGRVTFDRKFVILSGENKPSSEEVSTDAPSL